jgi:hypothetical protein
MRVLMRTSIHLLVRVLMRVLMRTSIHFLMRALMRVMNAHLPHHAIDGCISVQEGVGEPSVGMGLRQG